MSFLALFSPFPIIAIPFLVLACLYLRFTLSSRKYWSKRGVPHLEPSFLIGNTWRAHILRNILIILEEMHLANKRNKVLGFWSYTRPALLVTDLDIIKRILVKDFSNFRDRGTEKIDTEFEPIRGHLFFLKGKAWRNLRVKLTPTFTSGKMKLMFPSVVSCGRQLENYLRKPVAGREVVDVKELMARYTTDTISSCAFGIETNSMENPESEFRQKGKKTFNVSLRSILVILLRNTCPDLLRMFKIRVVPKDISDFFLSVVRDTIEYRERNDKTRNDFLQLLIQLIKVGKLQDADKTPADVLDDEDIVSKFSLEEAAAQCFVFFLAGFETSSTALTFALYELARNPEIQAKLCHEIDEVLRKYDDEITYEGMCEMEYLDKVVQESLRKYPPGGILQRVSANNYHIPEVGVTIDKGTQIIISVTGIHHDPDIYPNPQRFDPERFSPEEIAKRHPFAFVPFGEGPRNCIGSRFGLMQVKIGLIFLLRRYNVEPAKTTPDSVVYNVRGFFPNPVGGMPLLFTKRV